MNSGESSALRDRVRSRGARSGAAAERRVSFSSPLIGGGRWPDFHFHTFIGGLINPRDWVSAATLLIALLCGSFEGGGGEISSRWGLGKIRAVRCETRLGPF